MTTRQTRVLIADDNRAYRRGVRVRLEQVQGIAVVGEVSNGTDAVMAARSERADVVLMDLHMPAGSGLEATRALAGPGIEDPVAVVVVTSHSADRFVFEALDSGAVGYLLKNHDTTQLVEAIRAAASGAGLVSSHVTPAVIRELARRRGRGAAPAGPPLSVLTGAELAMVRQLSRGATTNDALAEHLRISVNTVRSQLQSALKKTKLADRTQLALWGMRNGLDRADA
jgi:DNA-binding NarL/FixJ family response regulator